jgi:HlyD family secretion protein
VDETRARVRSLQERKEGVETKRPKPEEIARAENMERQAVEALGVAENDLELSKVAHEHALKQLERTRSLARQKIATDAELDDAIAAEGEARQRMEADEVRVKIAQLDIGAAKLGKEILESRLHDFDWEQKDYDEQIAALDATLKKLDADLSDTTIVSPSTGVVLRIDRESRQFVSAGTPILEVGDLSRLEVEVDFLSEDAARMEKDMPVEIFGRALGDRVLNGSIARIHPSAFTKISSLGVEQQRVNVIVGFDAAGSGLGDLFRVEVRVILESKTNVLRVPEGALFREGGTWHAFRIEDGRARDAAITTGIRDGHVREVLSGLDEGDRVILHPDDAIEESAHVRPLPSAPTP